MEERKTENTRRQNEIADEAKGKLLDLLLKPVSFTPSNMRSLRSFQRDMR